MVPRSPEPYSLSCNPEDLVLIGTKFQDYAKLRSIAWLLGLGARTTEGVVISEPTEQAAGGASAYARLKGWDRFMLRHDSPSGHPRFEQGGIVIEIDEIHPWTERFARGGICLLLEPLDPLRNGYNLSCLIDESTTLVEIAGPGFDASDLQRGHIRPHEIREFDSASGEFGSPSIIEQSVYKTSVVERKRKVWWKLHRRELIASSWQPLDAAQQKACDELIRSVRGSDIPTTYEPIHKATLNRYAEAAQPVIEAWRREFREFPAVLAGSFVQDGSFCFWDVNTSKRWLPASS